MSLSITLSDLEARLAEGPIPQFWNVLTDEWFSGELIPGSRRVPLDYVGREAKSVAKDAEIVVYCSGAGCTQSTDAAKKLADLGFTNVRAFEGGLKEWKDAGQPVEEVAAKV